MTDHPFPHWIIDGRWPDDLCQQAADAFPPADHPDWHTYDNDRERKQETQRLPAAAARLIDLLTVPSTCDWLTDLTGIADLHPEMWGGGLHQIPPGGHLDVHADFNRSPHTGRHRRLNLLLFLNRDVPDDTGDLELHDDTGPVVRIAPLFGRTVIFETSSTSFHGHPHPLGWPHPRRSLAVYFFTDDPPPGEAEAHSTVWKDAR